LDEFFQWFPGISPELVHEALKLAKANLEKAAVAA